MAEEATVTVEGEAAPVDETKQPDVQEPESTEQAKPEGEPEKPEKPKLKGVAKRLHQLTQERDYWRVQAESAKPKESEKAPEPAKTLKDFEYDEAKYAEYWMQRSAEVAQKAAERVARDSTEKFRTEQDEQRTMRTFRRREAEFAKTVDDYTEVAHYAPISQDVAKIVMAMEDGPELAYYLGSNPDIAQDLNALPLHIAGVELGRMAAELAQEKSKVKPASTKAPPPTPKVEGEDPGQLVAGASDPESDKLPMAQWLKRREKELAKRKGQ